MTLFDILTIGCFVLAMILAVQIEVEMIAEFKEYERKEREKNVKKARSARTFSNTYRR